MQVHISYILFPFFTKDEREWLGRFGPNIVNISVIQQLHILEIFETAGSSRGD